MLVSKNSQMEVNTGIQQQAQRVEVFTIDEISEPSNHWRKIAIIQAVLIVILIFFLIIRI